jgi:tripartite-type tricarboxylate transporter receptor subunit TctC
MIAGTNTAARKQVGSFVRSFAFGPLVGRAVLGAALAIAALAGSHQVAQAFPDKPIRVIVPYGAGTGADLLARQITPGMAEALGQPVVVENQPGAGATIGTDAVAKAPADGYTLLFGATQTAINPWVYKDLPFDTMKDLVPIARVSNNPLFLAVYKDLPAQTVPELVEYAKANPGVLNYTSAGVGSSPHLAGAFFDHLAGIDTVHVPYNNIPQAILDLVRGQISMIFYPYVGIQGQVEAGELRILASTNATRSKSLPDVPTLVELGYEDFVLPAWQGFLAPAGTPPETIDIIYKAIAEVLQNPETVALIEKTGTEVQLEDPQEFKAFMERQLSVYKEIVAAAGIEQQ